MVQIKKIKNSYIQFSEDGIITFSNRQYIDDKGRKRETIPRGYNYLKKFFENKLGTYSEIENIMNKYLNLHNHICFYRILQFDDGKNIRYELIKKLKDNNINEYIFKNDFDFSDIKIVDITDKIKKMFWDIKIDRYREKWKEIENKKYNKKHNIDKLDYLLGCIFRSQKNKLNVIDFYEKGGQWIQTDNVDKYNKKFDIISIYMTKKKVIGIYKDKGYTEERRTPIHLNDIYDTAPQKIKYLEKLEKYCLEKYCNIKMI